MPKKKVDITENIKTEDFKVEDLDGIGAVRAKKLTDSGITTPFDIIIRGAEELDVLTDIGKDSAIKLVEKVQTQLTLEGKIPDLSGKKWIDYMNKILKLSTGSQELDNMLGGFDHEGNQMVGGIETQSITEVYGEEGSGKTQLLFTLTAKTIEAGYGVLFIDCEGTFDLERLMEIAHSRGIELNMDKLFVEKVFDSTSLMRAVDTCTKTVLDNNIKLIIVDGGTGLFRYEFQQGRGDLAPRQNQMKPFFLHLKKLAFWLNCAVVISNQVMGNPDPFSGAGIKAIGGHIVGHAPKYILWFKKNSKNKRTITFEKSNRHAKYDIVVYLNKEGISDSEEYKPKKIAKIEDTPEQIYTE